MSSFRPAQKSLRDQPTPVLAARMVVAMAANELPVNPPPQIQPEIAENYIENGREYHGFLKGKYLFPCDEKEKDRIDIYHKFFLIARRGKLHTAPLTSGSNAGARILDVGTGTGIWAIEMADKHLSSQIQGIDLTMMQPEHIPPNLVFNQRDFEGNWTGLGLDSWDLIHMRMLNGSVINWPDLYAKAFRHLTPRTGWLEHVEIDMFPRCDDGSLPPNSPLITWTQYILGATQEAYRPLAYNINIRSTLERLGFVDISEEVIMIPLNGWHPDTYYRDTGRWYNLGLTEGLEALTLAPMTRSSAHWKKSDVDRLVEDARKVLCSAKIHAYCNIEYICTSERSEHGLHSSDLSLRRLARPPEVLHVQHWQFVAIADQTMGGEALDTSNTTDQEHAFSHDFIRPDKLVPTATVRTGDAVRKQLIPSPTPSQAPVRIVDLPNYTAHAEQNASGL